jgi:hypothetical protein
LHVRRQLSHARGGQVDRRYAREVQLEPESGTIRSNLTEDRLVTHGTRGRAALSALAQAAIEKAIRVLRVPRDLVAEVLLYVIHV